MSMDIAQILERVVRFLPHRMACVIGERRLACSELQARVNPLANLLQQHGIGKGDRVAVLSANSLPYLEMCSATTNLRVLIVPLNFHLAPAQLAYILPDPGSAVLLVGAGFEALYANTRQHLTTAPTALYASPGDMPVGGQDYETCLAATGSEFTPVAVDEHDLAGLFYTVVPRVVVRKAWCSTIVIWCTVLLDTELGQALNQGGVQMSMSTPDHIPPVASDGVHSATGDATARIMSKPRCFSAQKKAESVLHLLRGEGIDLVSRELGGLVRRLADWRQSFLEAGQKSMTKRPAVERDREFCRLRAKLGELTIFG